MLLPHLLQRVGNVRRHLRVLCEDQTGQQGGALLGRQRAQDIFEQQLGQQQLVAADLTGHAAFQLHRAAAVDVLEGLQHLRQGKQSSEGVCTGSTGQHRVTLHGTTLNKAIGRKKKLELNMVLIG